MIIRGGRGSDSSGLWAARSALAPRGGTRGRLQTRIVAPTAGGLELCVAGKITDYTTLHYTTLRYTTLHYTTLHYATLRYATLHYTTLHYTILSYTTLYDTILYYNMR